MYINFSLYCINVSKKNDSKYSYPYKEGEFPWCYG